MGAPPLQTPETAVFQEREAQVEGGQKGALASAGTPPLGSAALPPALAPT